VVNPLKVKEWLLRKIILKDVSLLEQDIIVLALAHVGNLVIGHVKPGND
jgi:hypothetical protein